MGQLEQAIATRAGALAVARLVYHAVIRQRMLEKQEQRQALQTQALLRQSR